MTADDVSAEEVRARRLRGVSMALAALALALSLLTIVGWFYGPAVLRGLLPGQVSMKMNAAIAIALLSTSSLLLPCTDARRTSARAVRRVIGSLLAIAAAAVGTVTLLQDVIDADLGIDELIVLDDANPIGTRFPGRMAPTTALSALVLGTVMVFRYLRRPRLRRTLDLLVLVPVFVSTIPLLGHIYEARPLYEFEYFTSMALNTAVALVAVAGAMLLTEIDQGILAESARDTPSGTLLRRVIPAVLVIPAVIGWILLVAQDVLPFDSATRAALVAATHMAILFALVAIWAGQVRRLEATRIAAVERQAVMSTERDARRTAVATIVHDLRSPLSSAMLLAELIAHENRLDAGTAKRLGRVNRNLKRMDQLITDVLDASRIEIGVAMQIHRAPCDLAATIASTIEDLTLTHGERFELVGPNPIVGSWDAEAIRRLLVNLLENGIKHGSPNDPVRVTLAATATAVTVSVSNKGPAIPDDLQPHVFLPFRQLQASRGAHKPGWGVGLTVVKAIAEAHGGTVTVTSTPDDGTTFTVRLPRVFVEHETLPAFGPETSEPVEPGRRGV